MMEMLKSIVLLLVGFVLLIKGADFFVEGSSSVAKSLRIPSMIVGLTIVAMGTSLPELAVSVTASLAGNNALAVSNVIGSNIFNLMLVCGACALFAPLIVQKNTLKKEIPLSVVCVVLLLVLGLFGMEIGRTDGVILLILFIGFLVWMVKSALKAHVESANLEESDNEYKIYPAWVCVIYIVGGAIAIKFGGDFVVDGASAIAMKAGLSQNLVGLTIVAMGTSLPEFVTSVVAARKNEVDMAFGNVIGSNIFNILFILGVTATISPVAFIMENVVDSVILLIVSILVWVFAWSRLHIEKKEGIVLLACYAGYLIYICMR
jgi:cation:H+ antiporter